jgi:hypothetical protein
MWCYNKDMNNLSLLAHTESYYSYDYGYHTAATLTPAAVAMLFFVYLIFVLGVYAIHAFLMSRIFKKAGVKQWIAWVPFYNTWKLLELGGQQGFWAVLAIIPLVNIVSAVFMYIAMYHIGLKLGKSDAWVVLAIFLPTIWMAILAFDSSKWHKQKTVKA